MRSDMRSDARHHSGFTLIELLVAISVLGFVAVLGWRGLDSITRARESLNHELEQTRGMQLAVSTDMLVEGRHFLSTVDPRRLGHKCLAVNLSDLAACGATPRAFTLALALPAADEAWLSGFAQGLFAQADGGLIGRGFGNSSNWTTIFPHYSESGDPSSAVSPDNGVAQVNAGQTATICVNLYNDGFLGGLYHFNKSNGAQLAVLTVPQG